VERGEVFGILGLNGAGKSTLLACIAGITPPSSGTVITRGQVGALLKLGVGFHPHFSGAENIIMGMIASGHDVKTARESVDEVLDFAELDHARDRPFFTYSSGMQARLQFSVATHKTPEILIVDEALSAGDGVFVAKANRRIEDICRGGSTVLLVSHSLSWIELLCHRAMILKEGEIHCIGSGTDVGRAYRTLLLDQATSSLKSHVATPADGGTGEIVITSSSVVYPDVNDWASWDRQLKLSVDLFVPCEVFSPRVVVDILDASSGVRVATVNENAHVGPESRTLMASDLGRLHGHHRLEFVIPRLPLGGGKYFWSIALYPATPRLALETVRDSLVFRAVVDYFQVESFPDLYVGRTALVEIPLTVSVRSLEKD